MSGSKFLTIAVMTLMAASAAQGQDGRDSAGTAARARVEAPAPWSNAASTAAPEANSRAAGPTLERASAGVKFARPTEAGLPKPAPIPAESRQNKALMIVGGAAFIAGAVIDKPAGTILMLGGAGVGLWGLYRYLE